MRALNQTRRWIRVFLLSAAACAGTAGAQTTTAPKPTPTFKAWEFLDSVGVNTHLTYTTSFYMDRFDVLKQRLAAARIKHIRDGAIDNLGGFWTRDQYQRFAELGNAGIRVTFIFRQSVPKEFVQGFPARVAPAFGSYESPNELNNKKMENWVEVLRTWVPTLRQYVLSNPTTAGYAVIGPSLVDLGAEPFTALGSLEAYIDYGNVHHYVPGYHPGNTGYGRRALPPCDAYRYGQIQYGLCLATKVSGTKPIICTETGYGTNPAINHQVTPAIQAKYIARLLLLQLKLGVKRTFIYQLADYGKDSFQDYGLLTADGTEKPSFVQLRELMNELNDVPTTNAPTPLSLSLAGSVSGVESVMFQKSDGSYRLILWLEKSGYDPNANAGAGAPVVVPPQSITLTLPSTHQVRRILTFRATGVAVAQYISTVTSPMPLSITDNLTIVDLAPPPVRPLAPEVTRPL